MTEFSNDFRPLFTAHIVWAYKIYIKFTTGVITMGIGPNHGIFWG